MTTYYTISSATKLMSGCGFTEEIMYDHCQKRKIFSILFEGNTLIPSDSLARFLLYNKVCLYVVAKNIEGESDEEMRTRDELTKLIKELANHDTWQEVYTRQQIADIFGAPIKDVNRGLRKKGGRNILFLPKEIPITSLLIYLRKNPDAYSQLQERHSALLENGLEPENEVRHVLMMYLYYESNGYII